VAAAITGDQSRTGPVSGNGPGPPGRDGATDRAPAEGGQRTGIGAEGSRCPPGAGPAAVRVPAPRMVIEVTASAGTVTVVISGELDAVTTPLLARRLAPILAHGPQRLVFDLTGVGYIDCAATRLIVGTGGFLPTGRRPVILRPSPAVRKMLELTGLAAYVRQTDSQADAGGCS
jgi:anti-sigma B factor antagonist